MRISQILFYIKGYIGQFYTYSIKVKKHIVVILHIYGARAIVLLFYVDQDTKYT